MTIVNFFLLIFRRKLALLWEVKLLCRNAQTYNEEDSLIVEHARILTETLWKFIKYALVTTLVVWEVDCACA